MQQHLLNSYYFIIVFAYVLISKGYLSLAAKRRAVVF